MRPTPPQEQGQDPTPGELPLEGSPTIPVSRPARQHPQPALHLEAVAASTKNVCQYHVTSLQANESSLPSSWARSGQYRPLPRMNPYSRIPAASPAAADSAERLYSDITTMFPGIIADFNNKWTAWTSTWFPNERSNEQPNSDSVSPRSSSASDRCLIPEFEELTALGPKIIPLVVYKLASEPQSFLGVQLYNKLEKDKSYLANPADLTKYMVLQRQANLIVDMNYDRNRLVQARIEAWKAHCTRSQVHSSSAMYTECQEYDKLLELDSSIIAHLMVAYSRDQTGFWFELLNEIVHGYGKKTGLRTINFKQQYAAWNSWFQRMEHSKAP